MMLAQATVAAAQARPGRAQAPHTLPQLARLAPTAARPARIQLRCAAAATAQAEGVVQLLAASGVAVDKQAAAPSPAGLVCSRAVKAGEQLLAIPQAAWITAETAAAQPDIGRHLAG